MKKFIIFIVSILACIAPVLIFSILSKTGQNLTENNKNELSYWYIVDQDGYMVTGSSINSDGVEKIIIPSTYSGKPVVKMSMFNCYSSLKSVTIPDTIEEIDSATFENCGSLYQVSMGNGVKKIGESAFKNCKSLSNINFSNKVVSIGISAFEGCSSLTNVVVPDSVTWVGFDAFKDCTSLYSATTGSGLDRINQKMFYHCTSLSAVTIGNNVTEICTEAFSGTALETVEIPNKVKTIGTAAFFSCPFLSSISIPSSLTICILAFDECYKFTTINYRGTKSSWKMNVRPSFSNSRNSVKTIKCIDGELYV